MFQWSSRRRSLIAPSGVTLVLAALSCVGESQSIPKTALPSALALPESVAPALMPLPASLERRAGTMRLDQNFKVVLEGYREPRLNRAATRLQQRMGRETGLIF